jgi:hypothetical protein
MFNPTKNHPIMPRVFEITPKRIKRTNNTVLTPEMKVTVTTKMHTFNPFYNGAEEVKEAYMRLYGFDYKNNFSVYSVRKSSKKCTFPHGINGNSPKIYIFFQRLKHIESYHFTQKLLKRYYQLIKNNAKKNICTSPQKNVPLRRLI